MKKQILLIFGINFLTTHAFAAQLECLSTLENGIRIDVKATLSDEGTDGNEIRELTSVMVTVEDTPNEYDLIKKDQNYKPRGRRKDLNRYSLARDNEIGIKVPGSRWNDGSEPDTFDVIESLIAQKFISSGELAMFAVEKIDCGRECSVTHYIPLKCEL